MNSSLHVRRSKTHERYFELQHFSLLFTFILGNQSSLEIIDTLNYTLNFLSSNISEALFWCVSQCFNTYFHKLRTILLDEFFVIHEIGVAEYLDEGT